MRLYLDDDSASLLLARLLRRARHDVERPVDVGMDGKDDPVHLGYAVQSDRVLSHNHRDFENLHNLVMTAQGITRASLWYAKTTIRNGIWTKKVSFAPSASC
jgi:hypothetical protein